MPPEPVPVLEDNTDDIKWATKDGMTSDRRHVKVEYYYSVEEIRIDNVELRHIPSNDNPADVSQFE